MAKPEDDEPDLLPLSPAISRAERDEYHRGREREREWEKVLYEFCSSGNESHMTSDQRERLHSLHEYEAYRSGVLRRTSPHPSARTDHPEAFVRAYKQAFQTIRLADGTVLQPGGCPWTDEVVLQWILKPINFGRSRGVTRERKRGRPAVDPHGPSEQPRVYAQAYQRRKELYRRLKKLPEWNRTRSWLEKNRRYVEILHEVLLDQHLATPANRMAAVLDRTSAEGVFHQDELPSERSVYRHLAYLAGRYGSK